MQKHRRGRWGEKGRNRREREREREGEIILNDRKLGKEEEGTDILKFISFTVRVFEDLLIWANFKAGTF